MAVLAGSAVVLIAAFVALAWALRSQGWASPVDESMSAWLRTLRAPALTDFMWVVSLPGDPSVIAPFTAITALLLALWGLRSGAVLLLVTMTAEAAVQSVLAAAFARPRPPVGFALIRTPMPHSFPSGHAWASLLYVAIMALVLWRSLPARRGIRVAIIAVAAAIALLVGASRMYLAVHWPTDVVGGWMLALLSFGVASAAYLWIVQRFNIRERGAPWGPLWLRIALTAAGLAAVVGLVVYSSTLDPLTPAADRGLQSDTRWRARVTAGATASCRYSPRRRSSCA